MAEITDYTKAGVDAAVAAAVAAIPTLAPEGVQDVVGAMVVAAGGTYDDAAGTITLPTGGGSGIALHTHPAVIAQGADAAAARAAIGLGTAATTATADYATAAQGAKADDAQRKFVVDVRDFGAVGDGVTDCTPAIHAALAAAVAAKGGEVHIPAGRYRCDSRIIVPNDGENQPPITLRGVGGSWQGSLDDDPDMTYGSILDIRDATGPAKLSTFGHGFLKIQGVTFADLGATPVLAPYLQTTATTLRVNNCAFVGHASLSGQGCKQDAVVLGSTEFAPGPRETAAFHGYGTIIEGNYFSRIRRGVWMRSRANSNVVSYNTWNMLCGATTAEAAVEMDATGTECNASQIHGNLFEVTNYPYAVKCISSNQNTIAHNKCWDPSGVTLALLRIEGSSDLNEVDGNHWPTGVAESILSSGTTSGLARVRGRSRSTLLGGFQATGGKDENSIKPLAAATSEYDRLFGIFRSSAEPVSPGGVIFAVLQAGEVRAYGTNPKFALPEGSLRHAAGSLQVVRDTAGEIRLDPGAQGYVRIANSGTLRLTAVPTASRPTLNLAAGAAIFDTTLNKPVWYTGSAWVDAVGTVV